MEHLLTSLKGECILEDYKSSIKLLYTYINNINSNPTKEKYRKLKIANEKFNKHIWHYESCRTMLLLAGFEQLDEFLSLPTGCDVTHLFTLLQNELSKIEPTLNSPNTPLSPTKESETSGSLKLIGTQHGSVFEEERKADMTLLSYLVEMGYSKVAAEKGLIATNNRGVQPAMDWISSHPECYTIEKPTIQPTTSQQNQAALMGLMGASSKESTVTSRLHKAVDDKHKYQEKLRLKAIEKAKIEKAEEKVARENLKRNLESERLETKQRFAREKLLRHSEEENRGAMNVSSASTDINVSRIRIKTPNGQSISCEKNKETTIKELCSHAISLVGLDANDIHIVIPHPHELLDINDETTIHEKGLYPTATIVVQMIKKPDDNDAVEPQQMVVDTIEESIDTQ